MITGLVAINGMRQPCFWFDYVELLGVTKVIGCDKIKENCGGESNVSVYKRLPDWGRTY